MMFSDNPTVEQLTQALKISAKIVTLYGEIYLPVFNRIHAELLKAQEKEAQKNLALDLAKSFASLE